jgi:hypothetical protein
MEGQETGNETHNKKLLGNERTRPGKKKSLIHLNVGNINGHNKIPIKKIKVTDRWQKGTNELQIYKSHF